MGQGCGGFVFLCGFYIQTAIAVLYLLFRRLTPGVSRERLVHVLRTLDLDQIVVSIVGIGGRVPAGVLARGHIVRVVVGVLGLLSDQRSSLRHFTAAVVGVRRRERFLVQLDPVEVRVVADTAEGHPDLDLVVAGYGYRLWIFCMVL